MAARSIHPGVHPTAVLSGDVQLDEGVTVGPYCVISGRVKIGAGSQVLPHTVIQGTTFIGANCRLGPHAAIGTDPQHRGYDGRETYLVIEDDVIAREFCSIHRATKAGIEHATRIGRGTMLMAGSHVAHDCRVGEDVTFANDALIGGHVTVGDQAFLGGGAMIHQLTRVGRLSMVGGGELVAKDVLPFGTLRHGGHRAYNAVGCRRAGLDAAALRSLRAAFQTFSGLRSFLKPARAMRDAKWADLSPEVREMIEFIETSHRGVMPSAHGDESIFSAE